MAVPTEVSFGHFSPSGSEVMIILDFSGESNYLGKYIVQGNLSTDKGRQS